MFWQTAYNFMLLALIRLSKLLDYDYLVKCMIIIWYSQLPITQTLVNSNLALS